MSSLRPYHAFEIDGSHYVYSVWGMSYRRVSAGTIEELAKAGDDAGAELGLETLEIIKELGLRWSDKVRCEADIQERDRLAAVAAREKPDAIRHVLLFVTQECNMRCPYCYGDGGRYGAGGAMSDETAFRAVDWLTGEAGDSRELYISFFGGEPLLNFALIEKVVPYARERVSPSSKLVFALTTNLTLLDDRILDFLVANQVKVVVSFDGPPHIQNRNRPLKNGRNSYDTVVPKVRKLLAALPDSTARSTLLAGDDPREVAHELQALGFRQMIIEAASGCLITGRRAPSIGGGTEPDPHESLADLYRDTASRLRQAVARRDADEVRALASLRNTETHFRLFLSGTDLLQALTNRRRYFFCARALIMVAVAANGDIYPCHRFVGAQAFRLGNVYTGEFCRDEFLHSPIVENPECTSCWARYLCGGNCQHDNTAATGDLLRPDPRSCADRRARMESAMHAVDGLAAQDRCWLADLGIIEEQKCTLDFL